MYETMERLAVPIEAWAKVIGDYADYAAGQDISGDDKKWFRKQLDGSKVGLAELAGKETESDDSASGSDSGSESESDDAQSSDGEDSLEQGVQAYTAAVERLWKACDKNGDNAMATTEMIFCIRQGKRDGVVAQEDEETLLNSIRVGPQLAEIMLKETFEGSGIPESEWLDTLSAVTDKCFADLE